MIHSVSDKVSVIGLPVDVVTYETALDQCLELARQDAPSSVSAANAHIAAAARRSPVFGRVMRAFDLVLPDGMPLIWVLNATLRRKKKPALADRVYGPYFMRYAMLNAPKGTTHYFFGGSQECLDELSAAVSAIRPDIQIVGECSPPYRAWTEEDQVEFSQQINEASPDFVWVALGGEKQESWIIENLQRYRRGVFFAVGDAFELLAGRRPFAPEWCQRYGVTWLYRLVQEPRRMWKRYLKYNSLFLGYLLTDFLFPPVQKTAVPTAASAADGLQTPLRVNVLGVGVSALNLQQAADFLLDARGAGEKGYVCVTGVHGVIESQHDLELKTIHNSSFLTVPDGMPTVWMGREHGFGAMGRVYGPDLMLRLCAATSGSVESGTWEVEREKHPTSNLQPPTKGASYPLTHFLYGATPETLQKLKANLEERFPGIQVVGTFAPPFRPLNDVEEEELRRTVADCKPDFFWVGLSTPKQEKFMASHSPAANDAWRIELVARDVEPQTSNSQPQFPLDCGIMLGVGAAFDIHAGNYKDSPEWIKNSGMQWLHRLCKEPRRLWRRYLDIVPTFLGLSALQLLGIKKYEMEQS